MKKVILSITALAVLTGSAFAADAIENEHKTTVASVGVGAGHLHGTNGVIINADIVKALTDKDTFLLTKIEANSESFETKLELAKKIGFAESEVPVYFRGGIGYRSWTPDKKELRQALVGTVGLMTPAITIALAPIPMTVTPRVFVDFGVGDFDIGTGAGVRVQSRSVYLDLEAKNMGTVDGSKNTTRALIGVSYSY